MEKVKLHNDERLITLTKEAYDLMNDELCKLRNEKTVKVIATLRDMYGRESVTIDYYLDMSVPENIKPIMWDLEHIVNQAKRELDNKSKNLSKEVEKLEKLKIEAKEIVDKVKYVPNWIIKLFNK